MKKRIIFLLPLVAALSWSCASAPTARSPKPAGTRLEMSPEVKAQLERKRAEEVKQKEQIFELFGKKSDEYQNLLAVCEPLSDTEENRPIKATCNRKLEELIQELTDLKGRLEQEQ